PRGVGEVLRERIREPGLSAGQRLRAIVALSREEPEAALPLWQSLVEDRSVPLWVRKEAVHHRLWIGRYRPVARVRGEKPVRSRPSLADIVSTVLPVDVLRWLGRIDDLRYHASKFITGRQSAAISALSALGRFDELLAVASNPAARPDRVRDLLRRGLQNLV